MTENIIDRLKNKEDEMEALLSEARAQASRIKEAALKEAAVLATEMSEGLAGELQRIRAEAEASLAEEVRKIEDSTSIDSAVQGQADKNHARAVSLAMRIISEGVDDREDDEGSADRV